MVIEVSRASAAGSVDAASKYPIPTAGRRTAQGTSGGEAFKASYRTQAAKQRRRRGAVAQRRGD
ncbi:hypothetical protein ACJRO7_033739, partial [Eucalyptus globulus]